ncbi:MAG: C39 family peptidase [Deltaproteobacteria bacterium]|nr:C39 family peptidase [Deltaproteobacteria bacterium]MBN2672642.1 C39 family peptidase [Deltaproteobacteria bacterium]
MLDEMKGDALPRIDFVWLLAFLGVGGGIWACTPPSPVAGASTSEASDFRHPSYQNVLIENVPHIRQKPDFCGEACAAMMLNYLGEEVDQDYVFDAAGVDPSVGRGLVAAELNRALIEIGFDTGAVWNPVRSKRDVYKQFAEMLTDLGQSISSIVCMNTTDDAHSSEHFRLVLGYDAERDEVIYHEPAIEDGAYRRMSTADFIRLWPLHSAKDSDTVVRMKMLPKRLSFGEISSQRTAADFVQHVIAKRSMMTSNFVIMVEPPFVVFGNGTPAQVAVHAKQTVRWTVELLMRDYFTKEPTEILDIWVFEDQSSYMRYAEILFNDIPDTPYGYYSSVDKAMVMNIGLGGGTLVHEIVHPFMEANFPTCPPWFNEGMGSLYEWPKDIDGRIYGVVNWRLDGLKYDIENAQLGSFERLMNLTHNEFYEDRAGANYAQSRYLLQYLQYKRKLREYYQEFTAHAHDDPSGLNTLKRLMHITDMKAFERDWKDWVMNLVEGTVPLLAIPAVDNPVRSSSEVQ